MCCYVHRGWLLRKLDRTDGRGRVLLEVAQGVRGVRKEPSRKQTAPPLHRRLRPLFRRVSSIIVLLLCPRTPKRPRTPRGNLPRPTWVSVTSRKLFERTLPILLGASAQNLFEKLLCPRTLLDSSRASHPGSFRRELRSARIFSSP